MLKPEPTTEDENWLTSQRSSAIQQVNQNVHHMCQFQTKLQQAYSKTT